MDVEDFCFGVFDCLELRILQGLSEQRLIHVGVLAVPLNLMIVDVGRRLTASCHLCIVIWYNSGWRFGPRIAGRGRGDRRSLNDRSEK